MGMEGNDALSHYPDPKAKNDQKGQMAQASPELRSSVQGLLRPLPDLPR